MSKLRSYENINGIRSKNSKLHSYTIFRRRAWKYQCKLRPFRIESRQKHVPITEEIPVRVPPFPNPISTKHGPPTDEIPVRVPPYPNPISTKHVPPTEEIAVRDPLHPNPISTKHVPPTEEIAVRDPLHPNPISTKHVPPTKEIPVRIQPIPNPISTKHVPPTEGIPVRVSRNPNPFSTKQLPHVYRSNPLPNVTTSFSKFSTYAMPSTNITTSLPILNTLNQTLSNTSVSSTGITQVARNFSAAIWSFTSLQETSTSSTHISGMSPTPELEFTSSLASQLPSSSHTVSTITAETTLQGQTAILLSDGTTPTEMNYRVSRSISNINNVLSTFTNRRSLQTRHHLRKPHHPGISLYRIQFQVTIEKNSLARHPVWYHQQRQYLLQSLRQ